MKSPSIGLAIVGCGNVAARHAQAIADVDRVRLVTVFDLDSARASDLASQHGVEPASGYAELLERPGVDAVLVTTPATAHAEVALPAIESGKHVLLEKPIDVDLERARALLAAAEDHDKILSVVSQNRFHDDVLWARRALTSGVLGRPILITAFSLWSRDQQYYDAAPGRGRHDAREGGVLLNQGVHYLDLMLWLFGRPRTVSGHRGLLTHEIAGEDTLTLSLEFESGAMGTFQASTSVFPQQPERIEVRCSKGGFTLCGGCATDWKWRDEIDLDPPPSASAGSEPDRLEPFRRQHRDFADAILEARPPLVTAREAFDVLALIQTVYQSPDPVARVQPA